MTYDALENSREAGIPASLYLFEWGGGATSFHAYCDIDQPVTYDGKTYAPMPIGRGRVEVSGTPDKKQLEIEIDPRAAVVGQFADNPPSQKMGLVIRQGHIGDGEWPVVWTGVVTSLTRESPNARISATALDSILARPGLRRTYMRSCPFVLYSDACGATAATLRVTITPGAVGTNYVDLAAGWSGAVDRDRYRGGYIQWTDSYFNTQTRTIIKRSGDRLILGNTRGLGAGIEIKVFAGCRHTLQDCRDLHNNIVNFGGQPYIPLENPVGATNRYY